MQHLTLRITQQTDDEIAIRLMDAHGREQDRRALPSREVRTWLRQTEEAYGDYFRARVNNLAELGQRLFDWLDGEQRWLQTALQKYPDLTLSVSVDGDVSQATPKRLRHLPWELLYNGGWLCGHATRPFTPARNIAPFSETAAQAPHNRPLRVLFVACSPIDVKPVLAYENEEVAILRTTQKHGIELVVEETGSLRGLRERLAAYGKGYFDVVHLTGHAAIDNKDGSETPVFVMEDDLGKRQDASAADLNAAFQGRLPRLLFLSGCHTGEAPQIGAMPSLAEAMVNAGIGAVLGWALPVRDSTGIAAAMRLYEQLATGMDVDEAVARTRSDLLKAHQQSKDFPDWHMLRLYCQPKALTALVTAPLTPKRAPLPKIRPISHDFVDLSKKMRVCPSDQFVGRRRAVQRCLEALKYPASSDDCPQGVQITGMGGLGKSSLAARLCQRMADTHPRRVVLFGALDDAYLEKSLNDVFGDVPKFTATLAPQDEDEALKFRLRRVLDEMLSEHPTLFVLDDFEQNLEAVGEGYRIKPAALATLTALLVAIRDSASQCRLIVTCRVRLTLPAGYQLTEEALPSLHEAELDKKLAQLPHLNGKSGSATAELRAHAVQLATGNPRLLEWLDKALGDADLPHSEMLAALDGVLAEFREKAWVNKLLAQQPKPALNLLGRAAVYRLPMPLAAWRAVLPDGLATAQLDRLCGLGLVERSNDAAAYDLNERYLVAPVLLGLLDPMLAPWGLAAADHADAVSRAASHLHGAWLQDELNRDEQMLAFDLALQAKHCEGIAAIGANLAHELVNATRYREAQALSELGLAQCEDGRLRHTLAKAQHMLGDSHAARQNYQRARFALQTKPFEQLAASEQRDFAAIIHNSAILEMQFGDLDGTIALCRQSLDIEEKLGDLQGKSATLHSMGKVLEIRGDLDGAMALYLQSLNLDEKLSDLKGKAITLSQMGNVLGTRGDLDGAMALYRHSLDILEKLSGLKGKNVTLANMANLLLLRGRSEEALALYIQSFHLSQQQQDLFGMSNVLAMMSEVLISHQQYVEALDGLTDALGLAVKLQAMPLANSIAGRLVDFKQQLGPAAFAALWQQVLGETPQPEWLD